MATKKEAKKYVRILKGMPDYPQGETFPVDKFRPSALGIYLDKGRVEFVDEPDSAGSEQVEDK